MINDVYNAVQEQLNKNGRGILSPARFVLFAQQTQLDVLQDLFGDHRRSLRRELGVDSDSYLKVLDNVMDVFFKVTTISRYDGSNIQEYHTLPSDYIGFGDADVNGVAVVKVEAYKKNAINRNRYMKPTLSDPMCYVEGTHMYVFPSSIGVVGSTYCDEVSLSYMRTPADPNWTYESSSGKAMFNISASSYQDFELPKIFMGVLINGILAKAGLHIRDQFVVQVADSEEKTDFNKDNS